MLVSAESSWKERWGNMNDKLNPAVVKGLHPESSIISILFWWKNALISSFLASLEHKEIYYSVSFVLNLKTEHLNYLLYEVWFKLHCDPVRVNTFTTKQKKDFSSEESEQEIQRVKERLQSRLWYFYSVTFKAFRVLLINVIIQRHCGYNSNLINRPNVHIFRYNLLSSFICRVFLLYFYLSPLLTSVFTPPSSILKSWYLVV